MGIVGIKNFCKRKQGYSIKNKRFEKSNIDINTFF